MRGLKKMVGFMRTDRHDVGARFKLPKVGAGGTAPLTLRSKGRCAIKPRSAPELGRWASLQNH